MLRKKVICGWVDEEKKFVGQRRFFGWVGKKTYLNVHPSAER
jgi:hypothetical protein